MVGIATVEYRVVVVGLDRVDQISGWTRLVDVLFKAVGLRWPVRAEGIDGLEGVRTLRRSSDLSPASPKRLIVASG